MDILSLYYFAEVAKDLHITKTANRLYISQQTLSNHLQRLEEYYGTQLLNRKPTLSLTCAGEHVLAFAEQLARRERNLKDQLDDIENQKRGIIRFGATTMRMNACLPEILPAFSKQYPDVEIRLTDAISSKLEPMIIDGTLDFAIVVAHPPHEKLISTPLIQDQIFMCVSDTLLEQYYTPEEIKQIKLDSIHGTDLKCFERLPFCILDNRLGDSIRTCFESVNISPKVSITSTHTRISVSAGMQGVGVCFTTQSDLFSNRDHIPANVNIFPVLLEGKPIYQELELIRRKDRYLTRYSSLFVKLFLDYFRVLSAFHTERTSEPY